MQDCASICATAACFMSRNSHRAAHICGECAEICNGCADSCDKLAKGDAQLKECAELCHRCAKACEKMAGAAV
jgi:hypothetical protein